MEQITAHTEGRASNEGVRRTRAKHSEQQQYATCARSVKGEKRGAARPWRAPGEEEEKEGKGEKEGGGGGGRKR